MSLSYSIGKILGGDEEGIDRDDFFKVLGCSENSTVCTFYTISWVKKNAKIHSMNFVGRANYYRVQNSGIKMSSR